MIGHFTEGGGRREAASPRRLLAAALVLGFLARGMLFVAPPLSAHASTSLPLHAGVASPVLPPHTHHHTRTPHARHHLRALREGTVRHSPRRLTLPPDLGRWGLLPAVPGHSPQSRSWLLLTVPRGYTVHTAALLLNGTSRPLHLQLFLADGHSGVAGAFRSTNLGEPVKGVGAWMHLDGPTHVVVLPHQALHLPLTLIVPRNAPVGLHAGALEARGEATAAGTANGVHILIATQVGLRVYLNVPGRAVVAPVWSGLHCTSVDGHVLCHVTLLNAGTVPLQPRGSFRILTLWGATAARLSLDDASTLLPADSLDLTATWSHPTLGLYHVEAGLSVVGQRIVQTTAVAVAPPWWDWLLLLLLVLLGRALWRGRRRLRASVGAAARAWRTTSDPARATP